MSKTGVPEILGAEDCLLHRFSLGGPRIAVANNDKFDGARLVELEDRSCVYATDGECCPYSFSKHKEIVFCYMKWEGMIIIPQFSRFKSLFTRRGTRIA